MKKSQIAIFFASILIIGGAVGVYFLIDSLGTELTAAPDYELQSTNGTLFYISDLQPKVVLLDFMSESCDPCKIMNPRLNELYYDAELKGKFEIISVNIFFQENLTKLEEHAIEENITWTIVNAPPNMQVEYGVSQTPTFVIINPEGNITYFSGKNGASLPGVVPIEELRTALIETIEGTAETISITSFLGVVIGFAIIVGITSFFSPCSFPLMPSYVAHILGMDTTKKKLEEEKEANKTESSKEELREEKRKLWLYPLLGLSSGVGILISYIVVGAIVSTVGGTILQYVEYALPIIGGIFILLGIFMFTKLEFSFSKLLNWIRKKQISSESKNRDSTISKFSSTFLYGLGYGLASLGCNAPIFIAFSLQVAEQETILRMIFAYLAFAFTIIILMVGATLLISVSRDTILQKMKSSTGVIKILSGVIMIGVGIYLLLEFFLSG